MNALLLLVLAPSAFGIPGALAGWSAGRRGGRTPVLLAVGMVVLAAIVLILGRSMWNSDAFGAWAVLILLAIVAINACTAVGGVALARHAQSRDSHLT